MDAEGQGVGLLTAPWPYQVAASRESFSPDGGSAVYAGRSGGLSALLVRPVTAQNGRVVVTFETSRASAPVWSPTGDLIAFVLESTDRPQVWLVRSNGSGLRQLTFGAGGAAHPSFSPDGRRLAYSTAGPAGARQVWAIRVDGGGAVNLSNNSHDEWDPIWVK
jgi:TolB protein